MLQQLNLSQFVTQSTRLLKILGESYDFFKKNKLWRGIFQHKWILLLTIILSFLFTFVLFSDLYDYIFPTQELVNTNAENIDSKSEAIQDVKGTTIFGGSKFLMLIMLEVVIFHFSVKTLEILNNEKYKTTFGMFLNAEIRMIRVLIRGFIQSFIASLVIRIVLFFADLSFILPAAMFIIHSYFIGLAFFDNYNEQQKLNIKESDICIRYNSGAATTLGVIASIGLMIPIIGPLIVPVFGAITANIYGFRYHIENPPQHKIQEEEIHEKEELV